MNLRKELTPDLSTAQQKKEVTNLFSKIVSSLDLNDENSAEKILAELNSYVDKNYDLFYFREYWGWPSENDMIDLISIPQPIPAEIHAKSLKKSLSEFPNQIIANII